MAKANPRCPARGQNACQGELCGHCRKCTEPLDNHDGLGTPALKCPKGK